ncbi:MAG: hypothetical protein JXP73_15980 [Deltaproteobacteria bacterium]|nr:hypothetical protein [Deltaproteobacteria bacterium]
MAPDATFAPATPDAEAQLPRMVLYCLIGQKTGPDEPVRFLLLPKQERPCFPVTKFRPDEDLYQALVRPMERDVGLPPDGYFPERELEMIPSAGESPRYPGLPKQWYLYPVVMSLTAEGRQHLAGMQKEAAWLTVDEIIARENEPNLRAIATAIRDKHAELLRDVPAAPSMEARASRWAATRRGGVRVLRGTEIRAILGSGNRAFNLRVADPYLPYQRQGLGFTWSFFSPNDKQDVHVHGLPVVEIYGVLEGRLQVWHKPMNLRGVRAWQRDDLGPGDWLEVESLHCHFAFWVTRTGMGTVIKAAANGELASVGRLGVSGKTTCEHCNVRHACMRPPHMERLMAEYARPFAERDYQTIAELAARG